VLLVISDDGYVRNYLRTDALTELRATTDLHIVAESHLALVDEIRDVEGFAGTFTLEPSLVKRHQLFFEMLMWRYRGRSKTFLYRWMRIANWDIIRTTEGPWKLLTSGLRWALSSATNLRALRSPLLGNALVFPLIQPTIHRSLTPNPGLERLIKDGNYDLVMFPSSAHEASGSDVIRLGKTLGIPTLALIDNWDNLSSKTVLWDKPTHLAVWGEQTRRQAIDIHGCDENSVHVLGTPRFDSYLRPKGKMPKNAQPALPAHYILFVGSAMPFDEIAALRALEDALARADVNPSDLRVLYRPHPWQQRRRIPQEFSPEKFTYTELDPQFAGALVTGSRSAAQNTGFQPDLGYYPRLLSGARMVVGPLTTMLFEAALCHRPVLALAYADGHHFNTSRRYFSHFDGLERVPGFVFCTSVDDLATRVPELLNQPAPDAKASDEVTQYFLYRDRRTYPQRLADLVDSIVSR
jgi:hypothetical protein